MIARVLAAAVAVAIAAAPVWGCFVSRKSGEFECNGDGDCDPTRACQGGYCVVRPIDANPCPAACTTCDPATKSCVIECATTSRCSGLTCPATWSCTIACAGPSSCGSISCSSTNPRCEIECDGASACSTVSCASPECVIACTGTSACGTVNCFNACACDVTCAAGACSSTNCPSRPGGRCTLDGTTATTCSSTEQPDCSTCP